MAKSIANKKLQLSKIDPGETGRFRDKDEAKAATELLRTQIYDLLFRVYASNRHAVLIVLQGIDASGKDGTVRNLFAGANPHGIRVYSFKKPTEEELEHDILWRCHKHAPERGYAAIFNRSYYEEVTTVKVHPHLLEKQSLPPSVARDRKFFERRYRQINDFERMLTESGTVVLKFLLHVSKDEQKERLQARMKDSSKHWKFNEQDLVERRFWNQYMRSFQEMVDATSTEHAPWLVVPSDHKWYRDYVVAKAVVDALGKLDLKLPRVKISRKTMRFR